MVGHFPLLLHIVISKTARNGEVGNLNQALVGDTSR